MCVCVLWMQLGSGAERQSGFEVYRHICSSVHNNKPSRFLRICFHECPGDDQRAARCCFCGCLVDGTAGGG